MRNNLNFSVVEIVTLNIIKLSVQFNDMIIFFNWTKPLQCKCYQIVGSNQKNMCSDYVFMSYQGISIISHFLRQLDD